jgi:hypothetical protein
MFQVGLGLWASLLAAAASPPKQAEDCDALYYGDGQPRDFEKALACYRAGGDWPMLAIMQLNGEGTRVDVAGARASFKSSLGGESFMDADAQALDQIIRAREANPPAKGKHIDFCRDVAGITPSLAYCQRRKEDRKIAKDDSSLKKARAQLDPPVRPALDHAISAFRSFVKAEGDRAYQQNIDGTIRNQAAMAQEALARRNFMAGIKALAGGPAAGPPAAPRPLSEADQELNAVYQEEIRSYAATYDDLAKGNPDAAQVAKYRAYVSDYKTKSRSAQHEWVRYRDAMAKLAAARWPEFRGAEDLTRALVTEDRIRELRDGGGGK